ncbi:MAG: family 2 glycoside hydrolase [Mucilaginibacter sp.]|uniref:glycosyl hydrolase n=1 Tax=Mucilaginibacter sp. TaxID=1882438 RepID=UPI002637CD1C|nr:glycosyl hydrolase [Mucilaginibacter sp.]MDB5002065.1 family 2 glycoside hydrolase [Mucilaginibacter sp.]
MSLNRRKFIKLSSATVAGLPLARITKNANWYGFTGEGLAPEGDLYSAFKNPVNTSKPFVRWWWNGNRVVKKEISRELDMLNALGVGGVEINSIRFPDTSDPLNYNECNWLSDEWLDLIEYALAEAKKRGMICDIIMGSGWPFGGEFLSKEEQTQIMALGTKDVTGPQTITVTNAELVKIVDPAFSTKNPKCFKELAYVRLAPAKLDKLESVIDLDAQITKDTLIVNVPEGNHVLYFLVKITGYMNVILGAPGASGPVLNHYNKEAVQKYLDKMSDALTPKIGLLGNKFRSVFTDSMELQGTNWCSDMREQFKQRRKYDLMPYFPFILFKIGSQGRPIKGKYGSTVGDELNAVLERVRYDFEITKHELFQERFMETFVVWCKTHGVKSRMQAYGREFHPSDSSMQLDIPEGETWLRNYVGQNLKDFNYVQGRAYSSVNKFVSSAVRLTGKKVMSAEEITNTEVVFNDTLERIKQTSDQSNLSGVSHSILHGFNYSPQEAPFPGWVRYGTFFNERNPWWPYLKEFVSYKGRLSGLFQNAEMQSDIAVMHPLPDLWSKFSAPWDPFPEKSYPEYMHNIWEAIHQNGSGCDYISESIMQKATFPNGKLTYGPRQYKTLIVVEADTLHLDTVKAFKRYADAGGQIIFIARRPSKAPGFYNYADLDRQIAAVMNSINSKNVSVYPAPTPDIKIVDWYQGLQKHYILKPFVTLDQPQITVAQVHYKTTDSDAYFFSNYSNTDRFELNAEFDLAPNKTAWLWNPETGERYIYPTEGKKNKLKIKLGPADTQLIVFDNNTQGEKFVQLSPGTKVLQTIDSPWNVVLNHYDGTRKTRKLERLVDFKDDSKLVGFAGNAVYENTFTINNPTEAQTLNLGKVAGVSEVTVNGKNLGNRWYGDHIYPVKGVLKQGNNVLSIKLTTTLGNWMETSLKDNKDTVKWLTNKKQPLYPQGVMGPVELG